MSTPLDAGAVLAPGFRALAVASPDGLVFADTRGRVTWMNPAAEHMFGWPATEVCGAPLTVLMPERFRAAHEGGLGRHLATGERAVIGRTVELAALRRDGVEFPIELSLSRWEEGGAVWFTAIVRDLRERRRQDGRVSTLVAMLERVNDAVIGLDGDLRVTTWTGGAERIYGWRADEVLGEPVVPLFRAEYLSTTREAALAQLARDGTWEGEMTQVCKDGRRIHVLTSAAALRGEDGQLVSVLAVNRDVTAERARDAALRWLASIVDASADGVVGTYLDGRVASWNAGAERLYGFTATEAVGETLAGLIVPSGREEESEAFLAQVRLGAVVGPVLTSRRRKDGSIVQVSISLSPVRDEDGRVVGAAGIHRDDTARREADARVRGSEARLAQAEAVAHIGHFSWNVRADALSWSRELYRIFGVDPNEIPSFAAYLARLHPDDLARVRAIVGGAVESRQDCSFEHRVVRASDGAVRTVQCDVRVLVGDDGAPLELFGTCQDVTEPKALREQLDVAGRMSAVGTLAAGVAHEINNPLAYVTANLETLAEGLRELDAGPGTSRVAELLSVLDEARHGAERVRRIVRGLKTFSRAEEERRARLDVRAVLETSINMAYNEIRHRARLVKDYGDAPPVEADEARLAQVFVNLLVNAAQSIAEGQADRHEIRVVTSADAAGRAVVEVRDTGCGIAPDARPRIFDPFFTSKAVGVGTGLGLSIVHRIVTALGGEVTFESEVGRGTTFRVTLPAARLDAEPPSSPRPAPRVPAGRRGRVLVVDDEPFVASALRRSLGREHDVTVAADGREALDRFVRGERFDAIVCDLMMPVMTGMDLYGALVECAEDQADRVIFMTGGVFTARGHAFLERVSNPRLEKPFDTANLHALVRALMR